MGIIGLGTVGSRFVEQFTAHPDFELVAAWDPDVGACSSHRGAVRIADGADEVVDLVDLVYIAVPPLFHRQYVEQCVAADTAVFCEKPLGVDLEESRALVDLVETSGLPAGVNFVFSAAPAATRLCAVTAPEGERSELGEIFGAELRLHFAQWPRAWHAKAQWLRFRDQGGWIREVASHFVFLAQRALGRTRLENAIVTFPEVTEDEGVELCEVDALARLDAGGHPIMMMGSSRGVGPDVVDFTVRGDRGSLRVWDWYRLQRADGDGWTDVLGTNRAELAADAYAAQLDALDRMLTGESTSIATFREALDVQIIVETMLTSSV